MAARERPIGMDVDDQPLSGIEQLDQQVEVRAARRDVVRPEPAERVLLDRVAQQLSVGQPGQTLLGLAEPGGRRRHPVLGLISVAGRDAAQGLDAFAAAIEVREPVRRQHDRPECRGGVRRGLDAHERISGRLT